MNALMIRRIAFLHCLALVAGLAAGATSFRVRLGEQTPAPASGRVVLFLIAESADQPADRRPIEGPFWESEQPVFGLDVTGLKPGESITIDDRADSYPAKVADLKPGPYRAQACLIAHRADSDWKRVNGNLYSEVVRFSAGGSEGNPVEFVLTNQTKEPSREPAPGVEWIETPSKLLSDFRKADVQLRAGVVLPLDYDPSRKYPAIYFVPGFGGDDRDAPQFARERAASKGAARELARSTFLFVLNPEGPYGHNLFVNSANNGPCAKSLTTELIPALEKKYPLITKPEARFLRGHSSGGWSTVWLALTEPDTFGAAWSSSPDPVDFRKLQVVNIYDEENFYTAPSKAESGALTCVDRPSFRELDRRTGKTRNVMTIRRESMQEDVLGPDNTSGQQWDSWFAVFGPRNTAGHPAALFDPKTGVIDHAVAEQFRAFDIGSMLRADPERYLPLMRSNVRILVGDADSFFLNEAVALLKADVERLTQAPPEFPVGAAPQQPPAPPDGYIKILHGYDHGTIFGSPEVRALDQEMLDELGKAGNRK